MTQWFRLPGKGLSGLSLQLFFLVLLPLTLLLLLVAVGSSLLHQQAMRTMVGERDERASRAAAAAVSEQLEQRAGAVQGLAQRAAAMEEPAQALRDVGPLLPEFEAGMAVFAPGGELLAATAQQEEWQNLASTILGVGDGTSGGEATFFFAPALAGGAGSGSHALVVAATVEGFTAAGAFSPNTLVRNALSPVFGGGDAATAAVVTADGELIYRAGPPLLAEAQPLQHPGVVSALRGESGTTYFSDRDESRGDAARGIGEHVVAFSPITPVGWALVVEEPWQMLAGPLLRTTEWAPLVLAPVLLIALIGLGFGALQIVQPLQSLEQKATALAWGDFQAIEEPVGGIAEIQRLQAELVHMAQKVRSAQRGLRDYLGAITAGQEEERRRLARELHDDTIQSLIALNQRLQLAHLGQEAPELRAQLDEMQQMVSQLIADLRRTIHALRPIYLEDLGLAPALQMLVQEVRGESAFAVRFHQEGSESRLPSEVELALYRIAQEALSNAARHAAAKMVTVELRFAPQAVTLVVEDDGEGFVAPESPADLAPQGHYGLLGIHERAELIGAQLTLTSEPGAGTRVRVDAAQV